LTVHSPSNAHTLLSKQQGAAHEDLHTICTARPPTFAEALAVATAILAATATATAPAAVAAVAAAAAAAARAVLVVVVVVAAVVVLVGAVGVAVGVALAIIVGKTEETLEPIAEITNQEQKLTYLSSRRVSIQVNAVTQVLKAMQSEAEAGLSDGLPEGDGDASTQIT
jgi:hypothetical protein